MSGTGNNPGRFRIAYLQRRQSRASFMFWQNTAKSGATADWFTTPQEYDLAALAKGFQISFCRLHSLADLQQLEAAAVNGPGCRIIELMADRETNLSVRKDFLSR